jgi:hypothetical protein
VFHVSLLEPYHAPTILGRILELLSQIEINGEQKDEMGNFLNLKTSNGQLLYPID